MTIPIAGGGIGGLTAGPNFAQNVLKTSTVTVPPTAQASCANNSCVGLDQKSGRGTLKGSDADRVQRL